MADQVQFEAMRTADCSWHPCQLSFSPNGGGLAIKYENSSQDILMSEKEVLMRIRVRSLPLLEDDCTRIKPGDRVVCQNSEKGFFDAQIEKVLSVRHSKRAQCRCKFMIKWLHQDLDGKTLTVASSSIMRLANESINDHPTIVAFLESVSLSNSCFSSMSPQLTVVNDFDLDLDLHDLLEKQIEGIRNSVHGSKKRTRDEILGLEANFHEQVKEIDMAVPNARDSEDIKSPLNPLAARAALASRMSKLSPGISPNISNGIDDFSNTTEESLETEEAPEEAPKLAKTVKKKSLFPTSDISTDAGQQRQAKMSPDLELRTTRAKIQKAKGIFVDTIKRNTSVNGNSPGTVANRRLTRSVLNKEGENVTTETTTVGTNSSSNMRGKVTRSSINQDAVNLKTDTTKESDGDELCPEQRNKKINTEGTNGSSNMKIRATRSSINQEAVDIKTDIVNESDGDELPTEQKSKKRNTAGTNGSSNMKIRATRSSINQEAADIKTDTVNESDGDELPTEQKSKKRNTAGANGSSNMKIRATLSSINQEAADIKTDNVNESDGDELPTEQKSKKRNTTGNATNNGENRCGSKKKNPLDLNKHKLRSSPRLRS